MISLSRHHFIGKALGILLVCLASQAIAENAPVTLPYEADFETTDSYFAGPFLTDSVWNFDEMLVTEILSFGAIGDQSLSFTGGQWLWLNSLGLPEGEVAWVDFYLIPVFAEADELPIAIESEQSAVTGFVKVDTSLGEVYAIDGDGFGSGQWLATGEQSTLNGSVSHDWVRLTYRLDYTNKHWDLFVNGKMVLTDLGFLDDTVLKLTEFAARGDMGDTTILDYFYAGGTNPLFADSSNDGLSDDWLTAQGLNVLVNQRYNDGDADGLDNLTEYKLSTRADLADTDNDGANDGVEIASGMDPNNSDTDNDGALDGTELTLGLDPHDPDTDFDGLQDGPEINNGTDPILFDTDGDGLADSLESVWAHDPLLPDTASATLSETELGSGVFEWSHAFSPEEGFVDAALSGQLGWSALGEVIINAEQVDMIGSQTEDVSFERISGIGETRQLWISFRAKFITGELPDMSANEEPTVAIWAAGIANKIAIWDEATQQWAEYDSKADLAEWNEYALYFDYVEQEWLLTQNGQLIANELPFRDKDLIVFSRFKALQSSFLNAADPTGENNVASFDAIKFSTSEPEYLDYDGDGLLNSIELSIGSDLLSSDTDLDGLNDLWEYENGLNLFLNDAHVDIDGDGLTNEQEYALITNPNEKDTDGDGVEDLFEQYLDADPLNGDIEGEVTSISPWILSGVGTDRSESLAVGDRITLLSNGRGFSTHATDGVSYLHQDAAGDFELVAKVGMPSIAHNEWRSGLMLRGSLDPLSAMVGIFFTKDGTLELYDRRENGGKIGTSTESMLQSEMPGWLKLKRQGSVISAFTSKNGTDWVLYRSTTLALPSTVFSGMAVVSGNPEILAGATFREVSLSDSLMPSAVSAYSNVIPNNQSVIQDFDGDGVSDLREITEFLSDPNQADIGSPILLQEKRARDLAIVNGQWIGYGDGRYVDTIRGELQWDVELSESGLLDLVVESGFAVNTTMDPVFSLSVSVDGVAVGRLLYDTEGTDTAESGLLLPWLKAGQHSISLRVENTHLFRKVRISNLSLLKRGGTDADNDGIADWISGRISSLNSVSLTSVESKTSPLCITGFATHPFFTTVEGSIVQPGPNNQWFYDIPLSSTESQQIEVSHENGAMRSEVDVIWTPTNLLNEKSPMLIRVGDALRFVAQQTGMSASATARIAIDGTVLYDGLAVGEIIHEFDHSGEYLLTAEFSDGGNFVSASLSVKVVRAQFAGNPLAIRQQSRYWLGSTFASELSVEFDDRMAVSEVSSKGDRHHYALRTDTVDDRYLWARLPGNGSVVAATTVRGLEVATLSNSGIFLEKTYEDGMQQIRMPVVASRITDDIRVTLEIFLGGVLFDDGTTDKTLLPDDFDELGVAFVRFLKPPARSATCHSTRVFQDDQYIGSNR